MKLSASVILGLDHDRREDIEETIDFCKSIGAYSLQTPILTPYPGTPLYAQMQREKRIFTDRWQFYDMMHTVFKPDTMSSGELQKLFIHALMRFYTFSSAAGVAGKWGIPEGLKRLGMAFSIRMAFITGKLFERHYYRMLAGENISRHAEKEINTTVSIGTGVSETGEFA